MSLRTTGRLLLKTRDERRPAPAHIDVLAGCARPVTAVDGGGPIDRTFGNEDTAIRVRRVFHARKTFTTPGERGTGFADDERGLGLDRVYALELSDPARVRDLARRLTDLGAIEWAMPETLAIAPLYSAPPARHAKPDREAIEAPRRLVHADEALALEPGSPAITAGIVDTGVALAHPEFAMRFFGGFDTVDLGMGRIGEDMELVGDSRGHDFTPADETGHGSHVAGVIAANGIHVPPGLGGALSIAPVRALAAARDADGNIVGLGGTLDLDAAIKVAAELGSHVVNMSFGTPENALEPDSPGVHREAIAYAASRGAILIAAIGNSGENERYFPACLPEVIAVASVGSTGRVSQFSTWGPWCALAAPGENIVSVGLRGYRISSGTSHAAPFVTAVAGLMCARAARAGLTLTAGLCRQILTETAQPTDPDIGADHIGAGTLNAEAALRALDAHLQASEGATDG